MCDLFITAHVFAPLRYFQVDVFTGEREARDMGLFVGGVTLGFATAHSDMPAGADFCCRFKGSVAFSRYSPLA